MSPIQQFCYGVSLIFMVSAMVICLVRHERSKFRLVMGFVGAFLSFFTGVLLILHSTRGKPI